MADKAALTKVVDDIFGTTFEEREGRTVPETTDVALAKGAVKIDATFLYADLAGSGRIAQVCPWETTAKIIRAYLDCAVRLIRAYGGEIRSFDGDRVMGAFMGDNKNSNASKCAREIFWTTEKIIQPKANAKFASVRNNDVKIRQACGLDTGIARAVRAGIRNNNDLIWVGRSPSFAAKLSDVREFPYCTFISEDVYKRLNDTAKAPDGKVIWERRALKFADSDQVIYRSQYMLKP
ncbi:adenylate/guanylate cyclase domain-containing protein [Gluconobacter cerinus]|uniref:adenylate/guanylate cyclase domain-containing protein n=1 Tax=Gluconobacter cerinus TaxID=38307 RepID=UPI001B8AAD64|nr:adenylate/guanylate cyclase domain-containing protein [Gluconobacter cerinus]MBS1023989.1 adenylate/guanylate cyclase domain-containing protein [Gluconobacter cerinus]